MGAIDIAFEGMPNSEKIISKDFTANSAKKFQNNIRQILNKEHLKTLRQIGILFQ